MGLTFSELLAIGDECECKPFVYRIGCFECIRDIAQIPMRMANEIPRDFTGSITNEDCNRNDHVWFIQACLFRNETYSSSPGWGYGSKLAVSQHAAHGEIVKKFFVAVRDFGEHEIRESFKWKGRRILGPHISLDALWEAADTTEIR